MTAARRALPALACALLALACPQAPAPPRDAILVLGANAFAGGDRAVRLLQEAADATGVLGPARLETLAAPGEPPAALVACLRQRLGRTPDVRAVVSLLGDLSLLDGVDPSREPAPRRTPTRREPDTAGLLAAADELHAATRAAGATLLLASAPLGRQGRIEVPELLPAVEALRAARPLLDLQAHFLADEAAPAFANGIDELDDWGHDRLARALLPALLEVLPARDEAERTARLQAALLADFAAGREEALEAGLAELRADHPAGGLQAATRRLALLSAHDGLQAHRTGWLALQAPSGTDAAGLAVALALLGEPDPSLRPGDMVELAALAVLDALARGAPEAAELASAATDLYPQRVETWLLLQAAGRLAGPARDVEARARRTLALFEPPAVAPEQVARLFADGPRGLDALPALLCAARAQAGHLPDGPVLHLARRRAALGFREHAAQQLRAAASGARLPPAWQALLAAWEQPVEASPR